MREERTPVERDERALAAREGRRAVEARAGAESEQPRYREFVIQEQEQARFAEGGAPAPRYPDILVSAGVDGDVIAQVVVDSSGGILPGSLRIMQKSHDLFEASARAALETTRFTRPRVNGTPVRQLVQLVFRFRVNESEPVSEVRESNRVRTLIVTVRPPKR